MQTNGFKYDRERIEMPYISKEARMIYLERRKEDVRSCGSALHSENWELIARIGHKIKGNAETFGFDVLAPLGSDLENAAERHDSRAVLILLDQFSRLFDTLGADSEY